MIELLYALLRTLFPHDPVARLRELTRDYIHWLIRPLSDPRALDHLHASEEARRHLLSHIAVLEQGVILIAHHRARQLLGMPYQHRDATHRFPVRDHSVDAIVARLTRLVQLFDKLEALAQRRAQRMQRTGATSPLRLDATHQSTSPMLRMVEDKTAALGPPSRNARGRWIARTCAQDGGGCASSRGPPLSNSIAGCQLPQSLRA